MNKIPCHKVFKFGSSRFLSKEIAEVPIVLKDKEGTNVSFIVSTYVLDANTPFLIGKKQMKEWKAILNLGNDEMEIVTGPNGEKRSSK